MTDSNHYNDALFGGIGLNWVGGAGVTFFFRPAWHLHLHLHLCFVILVINDNTTLLFLICISSDWSLQHW